MTHFSAKTGMVRVELFRVPDKLYSGDLQNVSVLRKWGYTIAVDMTDFYNESLIHDAFAKALKAYFSKANLTKEVTGFDGQAICFDPYHQHAHPISLRIDTYNNYYGGIA